MTEYEMMEAIKIAKMCVELSKKVPADSVNEELFLVSRALLEKLELIKKFKQRMN